ncbi:Mu transposase C-terminal domain-containing protein [Pseudomonas putida]|uniref:Mu transposase C-terminal domain-containing protein n=1 Tax=Pseudomonas putida TaxID=303 RepID=UPI003D97C144
MAELTKISVGKIFQFEDSQVEILGFLGDGLFQVKNLSNGQLLILEVGQLVPILNEAGRKISAQIAEWTDQNGRDDNKRRTEATKRYNAIRDVMASVITKAEAVTELQGRLDLSQRTIYRLLERYDEKRGPISVIQDKRGRIVGKKMLDDRVESIIGYCIAEALKKKERFTYTNVHNKIVEMCRHAGLRCPGVKAVVRRVADLPTPKTAKIRIGIKRAADESRAKPGVFVTSHPFERVQIDHSPVDLLLVDEIYRLPIGRPWVTFAIDCYTRIIVGMYLSWSAPSRYSVACCIANMCIPKDRWLQQIGCADINYPYYGIPELLCSDHAAEFKSPALIDACDAHGMKMEWRREKHYGGHIESYIGTIMGQVHFVPGKTDSNTVANKDYDSEKMACMTFAEFRHWLLREVERYHLRRHSGLGKVTPKKRWNEHFIQPDGSIDMPPIISDAKSFKLDFMPRKLVMVRSRGVTLNNFRYWDSSLRWEIGNSYTCVYNPETLRSVWLKIKGVYRDISLADAMAPDVSLEQAKYTAKIMRARGQSPEDESRYYELLEANEALVYDAVSKTKEARRKKSKQTHRSEHHFDVVESGLNSTAASDVDVDVDVEECIITPKKVYFND